MIKIEVEKLSTKRWWIFW